jgi:RecB family exonuclease
LESRLEASFSSLSLYAACPLNYRYLRVDGDAEPDVAPDWRHAPDAADLMVASVFERALGTAVHRALARWQRGVDGGARASAAGLVAAARNEAGRQGLPATEVDRALESLGPRLAEYAQGPWPRRHTLFLEQPVRHQLEDSGFILELSMRLDRVVRYRRGVAILDFKTVPPHAFERRADAWQLRTYALAAPELLGVASEITALFIIDLRAGRELVVGSSKAELATARGELLECGKGIVAGAFDVGSGHADRPCWACGFRLACPSSLAKGSPTTRD